MSILIRSLQKRFGTYSGLLAFLIALFFAPLFKDHFGSRIFFDITISLVFVCGVVGLYDQKSFRTPAGILGAAALVSQWLEHAYREIPAIMIASNVFSVLFLLFVSAAILASLFKTKLVTGDCLSGAVCVYLLLGLCFACLYTALVVAMPQSFSLPHTMQKLNDSSAFMYFSFVTLTTLGFGDMTPLTQSARTLVVFEAILGQMYVAVLVALLVGKIGRANPSP